jgi:hypothetical protein
VKLPIGHSEKIAEPVLMRIDRSPWAYRSQLDKRLKRFLEAAGPKECNITAETFENDDPSVSFEINAWR